MEAGENIKIVYACESESRAWGFPSSDSDYDVRFLYVRPLGWYLSIHDQRDVIERPVSDGLDVKGWDLKKALRLFRKCNPSLLAWLGSPIVYRETYCIAQQLRSLTPAFYSPAACMYHYLHMARYNYREYLKGEEVWVNAESIAMRLKLSTREREYLMALVRQHMHVLDLSEPQVKPKTVLGWFRRLGEDMVPSILLSMADTMATLGPASSAFERERHLHWGRAAIRSFYAERFTP